MDYLSQVIKSQRARNQKHEYGLRLRRRHSGYEFAAVVASEILYYKPPYRIRTEIYDKLQIYTLEFKQHEHEHAEQHEQEYCFE